MTNIKAQTLKGFRDFLPAEARKRQYVINKLKGVFESFGFEPLETPALEYEEVLLGKYGDEGDKLMYRFTDNGDRKVALRYDQTVPLARVVAQYGSTSSPQAISMPFKRYQIQLVWRAENPQKGRFREFLQCDIDTVGINSLYADAEIIAVIIKSLQQLGFLKFKIAINNRSIFSSLVKKDLIAKKELLPVLRAVDKLGKIGKDNVLEELGKLGIEKSRRQEILLSLENQLPPEDFMPLFDFLAMMKIESSLYEFRPTLARGLDYYTSTIFEAEVEGYSAGSVAGGGRYDKLIGMFAGIDIPAVGVAYGFDRIIEAMDQLNLFPKDLATTKVLVTVFSKDLEEESIKVTSRLRLNNINCELWLDPETKLEKQLKYADQKGIPFVAIIGPNEAQGNKVTLKNLKNKTQETSSLGKILDILIND